MAVVKTMFEPTRKPSEMQLKWERDARIRAVKVIEAYEKKQQIAARAKKVNLQKQVL